MLQTKEQGKNPQDEINEEEIGNLSEKEFRVMIVKMIKNLRNNWVGQKFPTVFFHKMALVVLSYL